MNPLQWKKGHQIAFLVATLFGAGIGIYMGLRQIEPSIDGYWLHVGLWGVAGAVLASLGAFVRQLVRDRKPGSERKP